MLITATGVHIADIIGTWISIVTDDEVSRHALAVGAAIAEGAWIPITTTENIGCIDAAFFGFARIICTEIGIITIHLLAHTDTVRTGVGLGTGLTIVA